MNTMVKYHNDLNLLQMTGLKEKELDIFFTACLKLKDQKEKSIVMTFKEIRELTEYNSRSIERLYKMLDDTFKKLLELSIKIEDVKTLSRFLLFTDYNIQKEEQYIELRAHPKFQYLLNDLMSNYTIFELKEFISLSSIYSKNMYKILKQFKSTGWYEANVEDFRALLDVPVSYYPNDFNKRVIDPIMKELPQYFPGLKLKKIKKGTKIVKLKFTWDIEKVKVIKKLKQEEPEMDELEKKLPKRLFEKINKK